MQQYTTEQVNRMNNNYPWKGSLSMEKEEKDNPTGLWEIYATEYSDQNGRKYIALPAGTTITEKIIQHYKII